MNYRGVIIEESLDDKSVLEQVNIVETKVEPVKEGHKTPWLKQWILHTVEISEDQAEEIAEKISHSIEKEHPAWYADYKNDEFHFIIYPNKVFKVDLHNPILYKDAKEYGISLGIPESQVNFKPEDIV